MQPIITHASSRFVCLTALAALTLAPLSHVHGQAGTVTYTETFDDGVNHTDWTWDRLPGVGTIETADGNPDGFFRSADLMAVPSLFTSHSMFTGDFRARGVNSIGGDLSTVEFASAAGFISIILVHFNGTPDDLFDSSLAHFVTDIDAPVNPTYGWVSFDVPIPSDEEETPPGWVMTGPFPGLPPAVDWNELITNVDEVVVSWSSSLEPVFLFDVTRGADNLRITYQESGPPTYVATVLPQLDSGLLIMAPGAVNDSRTVVGSLGNQFGFVWSAESGGTPLQPLYSGIADAIWANSINVSGVIGGSYQSAGTSSIRPFVLDGNGNFSALPTLGKDFAGAVTSVNNAGIAVGFSERGDGDDMSGGPSSAVMWENGRIIEIGHFGGYIGSATAMNNHNVVVGISTSGDSSPVLPFRWSEETGMQLLESLSPDVDTDPMDINDHGIIVGRSSQFGDAEAVYWDQAGNIQVLPRIDPLAIDMGANAINNAGVIVGFESDSAWITRPRLWFDGTVYDLQDRVKNLDRNVTLLRAIDINENGDIVIESLADMDGTVQFVTVLLSPDTNPLIPGDLNGDGVVDVIDLFMLLAAWGDCEPDRACTADINGDGVVDSLDLFILLKNWG